MSVMLVFGMTTAFVVALSGGVSAAAPPVEKAKLTASDYGIYNFFGYTVAISGDTIVIGADGDQSAYVFVRTNTGCHEEAKLTAPEGEGYGPGMSVAMTGDTIVIGAYRDDDNGSFSGAAYVFVRTRAGWNEEAKLTASDAAEGDRFGYTVAVSGNTIVTGAYRDDDNGTSSGAAYVFVRTRAGWTEEAKLTTSDAAEGDLFGVSVAISGDTVVTGASGETDGSGAAYVFVRTRAGWNEEAKLAGSDAVLGSYFGGAVAILGDTVVTGASGDADGSGAAYMFVRTRAGWNEEAKLTASDAVPGSYFGGAVAISGDTLVTGAFLDGYNGAGVGSAYVFDLGRNRRR